MSSSLGDFIVTDDGETLYFFAEFDDGYDLWKTDLSETRNINGQETRLPSPLNTDRQGWQHPVPARTRRLSAK